MLLDIVYKIIGSLGEVGLVQVITDIAKYISYCALVTVVYHLFVRGLKPYKVLPDQMSEVLEAVEAMRASMPSSELLEQINLSAAKYDALHLRLDTYKQSINSLNAEVENLQKRIRDLEEKFYRVG